MSNPAPNKLEQLNNTCLTHFAGAAVLLNMGDHSQCESAAKLIQKGVAEVNVQIKTLSRIQEQKNQKIKFQEAAIAKLQSRIKEFEALLHDQEFADPTADASDASFSALDNKGTDLSVAAEPTSETSFNESDCKTTDLTASAEISDHMDEN